MKLRNLTALVLLAALGCVKEPPGKPDREPSGEKGTVRAKHETETKPVKSPVSPAPPSPKEETLKLELSLEIARVVHQRDEEIEIRAVLTNRSGMGGTFRPKQKGYKLHSPQFDLYVSGTGKDGVGYMNMMGFFGGDKEKGIRLEAGASREWEIRTSTRAKMVSGTPYGKGLPPGKYAIRARGADLESNVVEIIIEGD
ncbi:MAG: hypothetical protein ACYTFG_03270 [Planctomycetota bacterium]